MNIQEALQNLEILQKKIYAYNFAQSALFLDGATTAPKETSEGRGVALGILAGESQKLIAGETTGQLLTFLSDNQEALSNIQKRQVEVLRKDYEQLRRIPANEYMEYMMLVNEAGDVWRKAKEQSDFELYRPILERLVAFKKKFAFYYDNTKLPYDALLNEYERGVDMKYLDEFFRIVREKLVPLIHAIGQAEQIDDSFLYQNYPLEAQKRFSDYLMGIIGLDRNHCAIGETEHPFTLNFNNKDVRITTHYKEDNFVSSMYSVIHEGGHAKYELGIGDKYQYTVLAGGASMALHESQSRFYENLIGRSRAFIELIFPKMQEIFAEQLKDVTVEQMYRAINKVEPSFIRTESDELTNSLHVMIRYEIEKQLIGGNLEVKDVPREWNRLYKEYLGVEVLNDREGCLQDVHWSGGDFGYFPSYALGSAYGAQMLRNMEEELDVWNVISEGNLSPISEWLRVHVHQYGCFLEPSEIVKKSCGEFDPNIYVEYLVRKYTELYNL